MTLLVAWENLLAKLETFMPAWETSSNFFTSWQDRWEVLLDVIFAVLT